jgi:sulfoxide reductase catalytic subunit YedY
MLILGSKPGESARIEPSEITSESVYLARRELLKGAVAAGLLGAVSWPLTGGANASANVATPLQYQRNPAFAAETPNSYEDITTYNNFYEFGTSKSDPAENAQGFKPRPWTVSVTGDAEVTGTFNLEDLLKPHALEERIYRFRCVEAWSMVIPWVGFPLADLIKRFKPTSRAKYVAFKTVMRPEEMPGQRGRALPWPYTEGLRMDEAMNPLTLLAVGIYGKSLLNQNGAPIRLVTPWKYGFKSIKSIVEIRFTGNQPVTSWNRQAPQEYGFYANVNPTVDHPRWSQARERRIGGSSFFGARTATQMFNGYEKEVASMYSQMSLRRFF